jgi:U4/U6 small nuclear ribonucleoprotein PRP4
MSRLSRNNGPIEFEAMAQAQAKEAEEAKQIERARLVRTLQLPTDDEVIKLRLRACGRPVILFGEDPLHRRERLKEIAANMLTAGEDSAKRWHQIAETQKLVRNFC